MRVRKCLEHGGVGGTYRRLPLAPLPVDLRAGRCFEYPSSAIMDISASRSCRFHASAKRSSNLINSASDPPLLLAVCGRRSALCSVATPPVNSTTISADLTDAYIEYPPRRILLPSG